MRKMILAGMASVALAGAMTAAPGVAAAKAVVSQLSVPEHTAAVQLAKAIVDAVLKAQADVRGASSDQARIHIQLSVQMVIRNSGATPVVAAAALEMAEAQLADAGVLDCLTPKDKEQSCNPVGVALASLSNLLQSIIDTAPAADGPGGPIPLGAPLSMTPPNSGSSDYRGS